MLSLSDSATRNIPNSVSRSGGLRLESRSTAVDDEAVSASDSALYTRFREQGDADAFGELFTRHRDALLRFLWALSTNQTIAEDVSQFCWMRLMEGGYQKQPGATIRSYLYTIGRNRYIDEHVRKHEASRSQSFDETVGHVSGVSNPSTGAANLQTRDIIIEAMKALPVEQREVLAMWIEGFSINEMMAATGVARDTVLSRKKYAMQKTRHALEAAGVRSSNG